MFNVMPSDPLGVLSHILVEIVNLLLHQHLLQSEILAMCNSQLLICNSQLPDRDNQPLVRNS